MRDWQDAWQESLYGANGFFARGERPAAHFRTAPLVGPEFAEVLLELLARVDTALGQPAQLDFVDLGAGGGELAGAVRELATGDLARRLRVCAVDLAPPVPIPGVHWRRELPAEVIGLLVGHEWLDAVPCPVVQLHQGRPHRLLVDPEGVEQVGAPAGPAELAWLDRWWPLQRDGDRAEVGTPRDAAWANAVTAVRAGCALAVDYGHLAADRAAGRYRAGTLTGYQHGYQVPPVPDATRDITAHVALDACAAALDWTGTAVPGHGVAPGDAAPMLVSQADAVAALGSAAWPADALAAPAALAGSDPLAWLARSARAGRVAELRAPGGLGDFGWLLQPTGGVPADALLPPLPPWRP
ncbi:SAM-dependent methyltransferase [Goodfellowiella coeruleoviolacea]|uniref:SAM-dependent methyltransferase, MidA family n=1 Tax=Goodfellowiella coeruleoviolacea TaxID=334858 RepID=A0AAE3GC46_9PSEU|nr:SAM-dependent methyltransferase [Goodfellowiella coeruleoviolacea]MCP2164679.1 SAM-dependent methyltransferase, MidA family [Goodfellowiella coeruleoviolacea]